MTMDTDQRIKILVGDCLRAREACKTSDDTWIGQLNGMAEAALQIAADLEQARRLGADLRARNQAEQERANKELAETHAELAKVRKEIAEERKQIEREKAAVRAAFDDILAGKKVA
jgi:hypothetical protein